MRELEVTFTREQIAAYAEASGDRNPIHLDDEDVKKLGAVDVIQKPSALTHYHQAIERLHSGAAKKPFPRVGDV